MMLEPHRVKRWAHRAGVACAIVWWLYAFFSTGMLTGLTGAGLFLYLAGLGVVYALANLIVRGLVWMVGTF